LFGGKTVRRAQGNNEDLLRRIRHSVLPSAEGLTKNEQKWSDTQRAESLEGKRGIEIIQSGFFVGVFLEIRDHGHNFLFAKVKT
jgi:hypothetical protein